MINAKIFTYIEKYSQKIYFKVNDLIFKVLYFTFYAKNKPISNNVLIVVPDRLGDNILRIELIRRYINFFESQNIFFFVDIHSGINELIPIIKESKFEFLFFSSSSWHLNPFYKFFKFRSLNKYNFSTVIILPTVNSDLTSPFVELFKSENKFFHFTSDIFNYVLLDDIELYKKVTGQALTLKDAEPDLQKLITHIPFPTISVPSEYIVIAMGASSISRTYPIEKFMIVLEWLASNNFKMIFLGKGKSDLHFFNKIVAHSLKIKNQSYNLIGAFNFQSSLKILGKAKLFLGTESGLFNAANFLGIPLVVIYGGGHFGRFKHSRNNSFYVSNKMNCFYCNWNNCIHGNLNTKSAKCISSIEPENIISAIQLVFKEIK